MGYAYGYGEFSVKETADKKLKGKKLKETIGEILEEVCLQEDVDVHIYGEEQRSFDFAYELEKYAGDAWEAVFEEIAAFADGKMCFTGEDDAHWKTVLKDGEVTEYSGEIVFEDELPPSESKTWPEAFAAVAQFLRENEQYGDDWGAEIKALEDAASYFGEKV